LETYKIAIVGAGPAGYFTAMALQNAQNEKISFTIDMIEKLPTPWGLVRSGVAPDHLKIKSVSKIFEKIAQNNSFRLFANVEVGKDVSIKDLREQYDSVVLCTGATLGKKLGIINENFKNCLTSSEFIFWYNSHPKYSHLKIDLDCDTVIIIGAGNVAIDIARILLTDPEELNSTDISELALDLLKISNVKKVVICARRGPESMTCSPLELRNLCNLENIKVVTDTDLLVEALESKSNLSNTDKDVKSNLEILSKSSQNIKSNFNKILEFKFFLSPIQICGENFAERIFFRQNKPGDIKSDSTVKEISIEAGLVISAIGYEVDEFPGVKVENGKIRNTAGHVENNLYVAGWAKRGSNGVIGTNKSDARDVVEILIKNLKVPKVSEGITALLKSNHQVINQIGWEKINSSEVIAGQLVGKPRIKEINLDKLIKLGLG
jgi:ferredoxin--NADP+ reductase